MCNGVRNEYLTQLAVSQYLSNNNATRSQLRKTYKTMGLSDEEIEKILGRIDWLNNNYFKVKKSLCDFVTMFGRD